MPELPEVETTLRGIRPHLLGQTIECLVVRNPRLRWPVPPGLPAVLQGGRIAALTRRGKYLLMQVIRASDGAAWPPAGGDVPYRQHDGSAGFATADAGSAGTLLFHLGMSGSLRITEAATPPRKHDHYDLRLPGGLCLRFHDPRRFGCLLWTEADPSQHPLLASLGPEPLEAGFDGAHLHRLSRGRTLAVKAFIMDSHIVVGVGNIYASEALFRAGVAPHRAAGRIALDRYRRVSEAIRDVLSASLEQGGTTLRDFVNERGAPGYFKQTLNVYGRAGEPCRKCGAPIHTARLGQRSTFWCATCQH